jgi:hypothetical protein
LRATAGQYPLAVTNGPPAGGTGAPVAFTVTNPTPTLIGLNPTVATAGAPDTALTLAGSGFAPDATVDVGGTTLIPSAASATSLTVTVPQALLVDARTVAVTVTNPGPGGGTSAPQAFVVGGGPPPPPPPRRARPPPGAGERRADEPGLQRPAGWHRLGQ